MLSLALLLTHGPVQAVRPTLVVVGGGPSGFFGAIRAASESSLRVLLLEASPQVLTKVRISGGGRCNVCHDETKDVRTLASGYPRGERMHLGTFSKRFGANDAADWFRARGVELKTEADGRMFPTTDDSGTIVDALQDAADEAGVEVLTTAKVVSLARLDDVSADGCDDRYEVCYRTRGSGGAATAVRCRSLLVATGGAPDGHRLLSELGLAVVPPVPSLFTLDLMANDVTAALAGISVPEANVRLSWPGTDSGGGGGGGSRRRRARGSSFEASGPCLITHKGLSGPACLRLSAIAARELAERGYRADVRVNWTPSLSEEAAVDSLRGFGARSPNKAVGSYCPVGLPRRLWANLARSADVDTAKPWASVGKAELRRLAQAITGCRLQAVGKSTNKEEFVTAGGAELAQLDAACFEAKRSPGLFVVGEALDVDGITGGYNFLNCWASGWCAGTAIAEDAQREACVLSVENY